MKYLVIVLLICEIKNSAQRNLADGVCFNNKGLAFCCFNYEETNGICTECRIGTTTENTPGGRCVPCNHDNYGHKCIMTCVCDKRQRCDAKVGCIPNTNIPTIYTTSFTYTGTTETDILPKETITSTETTSTINGNLNNIRTSTTEWIIYTLCVTTCLVLTGFGHLFRTYRKRHAIGVRKVNEEVTLQPLKLTSYINDIYDDVDENPLTFVTMDSNVACQASHNEPVNFVFDDRQSNIAGFEDDEAGYFFLYFGMNEETNQHEENRALQNESPLTTSFNSNAVGKDSSDFPNMYNPLHGYFQDESHSCEVAVTVHQHIERSSGSDEETTSNIYSNVCKTLQKDRQIKNQYYENQLSLESTTVHETTLQTDLQTVYRTEYFQDPINNCIYAASDNKIANCGEIESVKDQIFDKSIPKTL